MRVFIIDDEEDSRNTIKLYLEWEFPSLQVVGEGLDVNDSLEQLREQSIDLLFLDVNLQTGVGFDVLKSLKQVNFHVVFITAYAEYAIRAIKSDALDYLLKPLDRGEFVTAVRKFLSTPKPVKRWEPNRDAPQSSSRLAIPTSNGFRMLDLEELVRCESDGGYTHFITTKKENILVCRTLGSYEQILCNQHRFLRTHKSHIVNPMFIKEYRHGRGGELILQNGTTVPVSNNKRKEILHFLS